MRTRLAAIPIAIVAVTTLTLCAPAHATGSWSIGTDVALRFDDNVGQARLASDTVSDTIISTNLSLTKFTPIGDGYSATGGIEIGGEGYDHVRGLSNARAGLSAALKHKWGLGALAPWLRIGATAARTDVDDRYRDAWVYRVGLSTGRRVDERLNLWAEYVFERRRGESQDVEVRGISSDAFSTRSHALSLNAQYALLDRLRVRIAAVGRHGDVVATSEAAPGIAYAARALAEDPAFGPEAYAYRLLGTTFGAKFGLEFSLTTHNLLSIGSAHYETRATAGNTYVKSVSELSWDYSF